MRKYFLLLIYIIVAIGNNACVSLYNPTTPNIPLFNNQTEFQIESSMSNGGINIKTAFSPVNHIGIQLNGMSCINAPFTDTQYHYFADGALGYYGKFNDNNFGEIYFGYGSGKSDFNDPMYGGGDQLVSARGYYCKYYGQMNYGRQSPKGNLIGTCVRLANITYTFIYAGSPFSFLENHSYDHFSIEPYFYFNQRIDKHFNFVYYFGLTIISGNYHSIRTNVMNIGLGIRLNFGRKNEIKK